MRIAIYAAMCILGAATALKSEMAAVRVVDGDTIVISGERIRLVSVDTPELRGARCERERALAVAAAERLRELLDGGKVTFTATGVDHYGRTLAHVFVDGADVGEILLKENHALPWSPGAKAKAARLVVWCDR